MNLRLSSERGRSRRARQATLGAAGTACPAGMRIALPGWRAWRVPTRHTWVHYVYVVVLPARPRLPICLTSVLWVALVAGDCAVTDWDRLFAWWAGMLGVLGLLVLLLLLRMDVMASAAVFPCRGSVGWRTWVVRPGAYLVCWDYVCCLAGGALVAVQFSYGSCMGLSWPVSFYFLFVYFLFVFKVWRFRKIDARLWTKQRSFG